jgi:hypothetical protein
MVPSPVMVWTDQLLADFLDYAADHAPDLHPLFQLLAYRGPRRGEACGATPPDADPRHLPERRQGPALHQHAADSVAAKISKRHRKTA